MWSEEEARQITALCGQSDPVTEALTIATRAVDLVSARGGTISAEGLVNLWRHFEINGDSHPAERIRQHIGALGARNATLEAEKAKGDADFVSVCQEREAMRGRVAELAAQNAGLSANLTEACRKADEQRERADAAERALDAERIGDAQMKRDFGARPEETLREMVTRIASCSKADPTVMGEYKQRWEAAESRLQRMRDGISDMVKRCVEMARVVGDPCPAHGDSTRCGQPAGHPGAHVFLPVRHPCSPTCAHDDAATPGHPERVKERSEAFTKEAVEGLDGCQNDRERVCWAAGREQGLDEGAEAMRAACLEEAYVKCTELGALEMYEAMKAAIEGAAP